MAGALGASTPAIWTESTTTRNRIAILTTHRRCRKVQVDITATATTERLQEVTLLEREEIQGEGQEIDVNLESIVILLKSIRA